VIAPDYPGFGNSDTPDPAVFAYTFDKLSEVTWSDCRLRADVAIACIVKVFQRH
jgi:hypothetical protein